MKCQKFIVKCEKHFVISKERLMKRPNEDKTRTFEASVVLVTESEDGSGLVFRPVCSSASSVSASCAAGCTVGGVGLSPLEAAAAMRGEAVAMEAGATFSPVEAASAGRTAVTFWAAENCLLTGGK